MGCCWSQQSTSPPEKEPLLRPNDLKQQRLQIAEEQLQRQFIVDEFLQTEKTYVANLLTLHQRYIVPLKSFIPKEKEKTIFGGIEIVVGVNQAFLKQLNSVLEIENQYDREQNLAKLLNTWSHSFKLYLGYIQSYEQSITAIKNMGEKDIKIQQFLEETQEKLREEGARIRTFPAYMILPIQRFSFIFDQHFTIFQNSTI